jgi:hypothetical protein
MSSTLIAVLRRVRHSRMLLAGIQAEFGLDPRLKHSGVTILESHLFARAVIFEGEREGHEEEIEVEIFIPHVFFVLL